MFRCFEYTAFLWKAKGRHGTHSPFAYWLVDQVAGQKPVVQQQRFSNITCKKTKNFLDKLYSAIPHFQILITKESESHLSKNMELQDPCIYLQTSGQLIEFIDQINFELLHPDTIFIVFSPHQPNHLGNWHKLIEKQQFHFSADCYYFGILSPKPGQAKQHFHLKLA